MKKICLLVPEITGRYQKTLRDDMREQNREVSAPDAEKCIPEKIRVQIKEEADRLIFLMSELISYSDDVRMMNEEGTRVSLGSLSSDEEAVDLFRRQLEEEPISGLLMGTKVRAYGDAYKSKASPRRARNTAFASAEGDIATAAEGNTVTAAKTFAAAAADSPAAAAEKPEPAEKPRKPFNDTLWSYMRRHMRLKVPEETVRSIGMKVAEAAEEGQNGAISRSHAGRRGRGRRGEESFLIGGVDTAGLNSGRGSARRSQARYNSGASRRDYASIGAGPGSGTSGYPQASGASSLYTTLGRAALLMSLARRIGLSTKLLHAAAAKYNLAPVEHMLGLYDSIRNFVLPSTPAPAGVTTTSEMPNLDLKAERTKSWEAGIDLVLFQNRLKVNATLYSSQTYNQFFNVNLPASSGFTSTWVNGGRVDNKGIELTARFNQPLGPVKWETYLTWTLNKNKIKELLPEWKNPIDGEVYSLTELDKGGLSGYKTKLVEGGTLSDIYVNTLAVGEHGEYYVDPQTHALRTDAGNYVKAGQAAPRYNLSWGNDFSWNGFSLGFQFAYRNGGIVVSQTQAIMDAFGASKASADARDAGGVIINGRPVAAADYYQTVASSSHIIGSQYVYSATNLRLSELSFGYDVPVQKWQSVLKGMNVSFVAHNLWMIYCKAPFDPEVTANTGTYGQGLDYFMQPSLRTMGFSVKLRF